MILALQILTAWCLLSGLAGMAYSAIRTAQKRRLRHQYDLAMAPYRACIETTFRRNEGLQ